MNETFCKPNLYIVGAPKCGTTAMADYLSDHPAIFLGHIKEPNYWSFDMPSYAKREGLDSYDDYLSLYNNAPQHTKYCLDASTHYLYSQVAIKKIIEACPSARFIVCMRPQHQLAQAWHMQMKNAGYDNIKDFKLAWQAMPDRRQGDNIPPNCPEPLLLDYQAVASLGRQIEQLLSTVPIEQVHFIFLPDIKENTPGVYQQCLKFLHLEDDGRKDFQPSNAAFVNRSNRVSRWVRDPRLRRPINKMLKQFDVGTATWMKNRVKKVLYKPSPRNSVDEKFMQTLKQLFDEDNKLMLRLIGRSFQ